MTASKLREHLLYCPTSGRFTWAKKPLKGPVKVGDEAGRILLKSGYRQIGLLGGCYMAHRLAWLYSHGKWPDAEIDHINGDRADNRLSNLRAVSRQQNAENKRLFRKNKSGVAGVIWHKRDQKWQACIGHEGRLIHLGTFGSREEAIAARKTAEVDCFGEFARASA